MYTHRYTYAFACSYAHACRANRVQRDSVAVVLHALMFLVANARLCTMPRIPFARARVAEVRAAATAAATAAAGVAAAAAGGLRALPPSSLLPMPGALNCPLPLFNPALQKIDRLQKLTFSLLLLETAYPP